MGTLNLTTADNDLTLTVNGTLIKQLYVNSTKVYQKWKTENYTETQNTYDNQKLTTININKTATIHKTDAGNSITYTADILINAEKVAETCETFDAFYFVVSYNGAVLYTSNVFSTGHGSEKKGISIGTWSNYGPDGTGNYNKIQPKIEVDVYVYEGTRFNIYGADSQFPVITITPNVGGVVIDEIYDEHYNESVRLNKRAYKSKTVSGTRRVEDN